MCYCNYLNDREDFCGSVKCYTMQQFSKYATIPKKVSRLVDEPRFNICRDPSHNPPTHMHIPYGKIYIHVCPSCQIEMPIHSSDVTC